MDRNQAIFLLSQQLGKEVRASVNLGTVSRQHAVELLYASMYKEANGQFFSRARQMIRSIPGNIYRYMSGVRGGQNAANMVDDVVRQAPTVIPRTVPIGQTARGDGTIVSDVLQPAGNLRQTRVTGGTQPAGVTGGIRPTRVTGGTRPAGVTGGAQPAGVTITSGTQPAGVTITSGTQPAGVTGGLAAPRIDPAQNVVRRLRNRGSTPLAGDYAVRNMRSQSAAANPSNWRRNTMIGAGIVGTGGLATQLGNIQQFLSPNDPLDQFTRSRELYLDRAAPYMTELQRLQQAVDENSPMYNNFEGLNLQPFNSRYTGALGAGADLGTPQAQREAARARIAYLQNMLQTGDFNEDPTWASRIHDITGLDLGEGLPAHVYRARADAASRSLMDNNSNYRLTRSPTSPQEAQSMANEIRQVLSNNLPITLADMTPEQTRAYLINRAAELSQYFDRGAVPPVHAGNATVADWANSAAVRNGFIPAPASVTTTQPARASELPQPWSLPATQSAAQ